MDRHWGSPWDDGRRDLDGDRREALTLPSRQAALEALRPALRTRSGPVLVTGDAGVGKTWLGARLRLEFPLPWRWAGIDPSPANDAGELYRLVAHALGLRDSDGLAASRLALADFLRDRAADGDAWVLVVDEAHGLTDAVLEEVRVLSNRLGQPDGFAGLVLLGQTALARRLASRPLASLASRIAARVHLRPLDVEEARLLLDRNGGDLGRRDRDDFERLHRDSVGNPRQLLKLARPRPGSAPRPVPVAVAVPVGPAAPAVAGPPILDVEPRATETWEAPVLGAPKPPLRVEDGLIEVGWDPEPAELAGESRPRPPAEAGMPSDEPVDDHYAALQAWNEWSRNQGRTAITDPAAPSPSAVDTAVEVEPAEPAPDDDGSTAVAPGVWSEAEQKFAPYSQLFSKIRQRNDSA